MGILATAPFLLGRDRLAFPHGPDFRNGAFTTLCDHAESTAVDTLHIPSLNGVPMSFVWFYTLFLGHRQRPVVVGDGQLSLGVFAFSLCRRDVSVAFFGNPARRHPIAGAGTSSWTRKSPHHRDHSAVVGFPELALPSINGVDINRDHIDTRMCSTIPPMEHIARPDDRREHKNPLAAVGYWTRRYFCSKVTEPNNSSSQLNSTLNL